ncbi:MAG: TrbI/VirB10 family protein [Pseudomonadota bacterium]
MAGLAISPKVRRLLVIGAAAGAVILIVVVTDDSDTGLGALRTDLTPEGVVLIGDARPASLEAIASELAAMRQKLGAMEREQKSERDRRRRGIVDMASRLERMLRSQDAGQRAAASFQYERLKAELEALGLSTAELDRAIEDAKAEAGDLRDGAPQVLDLPGGDAPAGDERGEEDGATERGPGARSLVAAPDPAEDMADLRVKRLLTADEARKLFREEFERDRDARPFAEPAVFAPEATPGEDLAGGPGAIRRLSSFEPEEIGPEDDRRAVGGNEVFIPSGSILSGVLLNGLDAPGGSSASSNPMPVVVRLKHEAILPNRFSANVRECFALLSSFGDLSSERAQFRGEQLSCVLRDGTVIQKPLKAYGVGEDGKVGSRGRVVTRQGQLIANAILVGALEGVADAFDDTSFISVGAAGGTDVGSAIGGGFSGAFDRIADWYLTQADKLFPVIEIDAGRALDVVLTEGMAFRVDL